MKLVKTYLYLVACYLCAISTGVEARDTGGGGRLLCWTNSDGVRECGDRIPPEYAQQEHEELNKRGMVIEETGAAKTEEELEKEKQEAAAAAEKERLAKETARNDKILLDTFFSVEEIEKARDSKIATLESSVSLAEKRGAKMQTDLDRKVAAAATAERQGKEPPEGLLKDIESLKKQIDVNNELIANTRKEQEDVRSKYDSDIVRFKELKSIE